ncbi:hypothetical protein [Escherichia coli]|uniref:hypothetical protein n=1 Tax=Escherichia coli TaxID=562 RepID=UPI00202FE9B0|nr:hypothetical protein [Escherichia coli]
MRECRSAGITIDNLEGKCADLAAENAGLKSNLMFWDADNPELPYDSPEEIASECGINYNEELVVKVAAKLTDRTYRVCESWDTDCKLELVEGAELQTPATDAFLAEVRAQGVEMAACALDDVNQFNYANMLDDLAQKLRQEAVQ